MSICFIERCVLKAALGLCYRNCSPICSENGKKIKNILHWRKLSKRWIEISYNKDVYEMCRYLYTDARFAV